jgi:hypothetical protein
MISVRRTSIWSPAACPVADSRQRVLARKHQELVALATREKCKRVGEGTGGKQRDVHSRHPERFHGWHEFRRQRDQGKNSDDYRLTWLDEIEHGE